jgi:hypothetical protein
MSTKPGIQVEGAKELRRDLKRAGDKELVDELKAAHREAAETVADAARPLVPVQSGKLLRSVRAGATATSGVVRAGKVAVPYAGPVHFGWPARHITPQPFLYDALDRRRDEVVGVYKDRIAALVGRIEGDRSLS